MGVCIMSSRKSVLLRHDFGHLLYPLQSTKRGQIFVGMFHVYSGGKVVAWTPHLCYRTEFKVDGTCQLRICNQLCDTCDNADIAYHAAILFALQHRLMIVSEGLDEIPFRVASANTYYNIQPSGLNTPTA